MYTPPSGSLGAGLALALLAAGIETHAQDDVQYYWRAYAQLTVEDLADESVSFGADRIHIRAETTLRRLTGGVMLDFGVDDPGGAKPGALANVVGDVYLNSRPTNRYLVRLGQFKTPVGSSELSNTYPGLTAFLLTNGRLTTRLWINYVVVGRDASGYTGLRGYRDNALLVQIQTETHT